MGRVFSMSVNKQSFLVGFLAMFLTLLVSCSDITNEFVPRKKLLESVVNARIKPVRDSVFSADFVPDYPGRYVIYLVLKQKAGESDAIEKFSLVGAFQVKGEGDVLIYEGDFSKEVSSRNTGATLSKFEVDRSQAAHSKTFQIFLSEGVEQLNQHFSEITLHVKRELNHSIFD